MDKLEKTLSILVEDAPNTYVEFTSARYKEFVNEIKMILTEECLREQLRKMDKTVDGKFKNIQNINLQKQFRYVKILLLMLQCNINNYKEKE